MRLINFVYIRNNMKKKNRNSMLNFERQVKAFRKVNLFA